jgi:hypothetical protein
MELQLHRSKALSPRDTLVSATPERRGFVTASQQLLMQLTKLFYFDTEIADSCELFTPDVISNISVDDCSQEQ